MDKQTKVSFNAADNGVSSFMKKLQADTKVMYSDFAKEAQKQTISQKEQLKIVEQQIKALERQNSLEKEQNKLIAERKRSAGVLSEGKFGVEMAQIKDNATVNKVQVSILKDMLVEMKEQKVEEGKPATGRQVFNAVLLANLVRDLAGVVRQMPNAQTQLDLLTPFSTFSGGAAGGLTGAALDLVPFIESSMAPALATVGKEVGGFIGESLTRSIRLREQFSQAEYGYRAFTGSTMNNPNLASMGYDDVAVAQRMQELARARGGQVGQGINTALGIERGFGIDSGTITQAFQGERTGGSNAGIRMQRTLGLAIAEGLDRARFTDAIKDQNQLLSQFAQTSTKVSDDRLNQILFEFNRMGGMFRIGDMRSMAGISTINEGLANPGSGFGQAMNYSVLRQLNPSSSIWNLVKMQEQGLQTPGFFKGTIDQYSQMGVSEDFQKLMFKERFKLSNEAIDTIFSNKDRLGSMTQQQFSGILGSDRISKEAEEMTPRLIRDQAEIANAFRNSFVEGIKTLRDKFEEELGLAAKEVARVLKEEFGVREGGGGTPGYIDPNGKFVPGPKPAQGKGIVTTQGSFLTTGGSR